jgi:polyvinyl alcohol dehydrogenase (cytochrome)
VTMYAPSGGSLWGTPAVDPASGTLYIGTGQNYTGVGPDHNESVGDIDSILALDSATGSVRWKRQLVPTDTARLVCVTGDPGYCPGLLNGSYHDWDVSAAPNLFRVGARSLVGVGHKNGVYHVFDAATGAVIWERTLGTPLPGGPAGIQWGTSFDGRRLYIATWQANPGTLFALAPATGGVLWSTPNPSDGCSTGGATQFPGLCQLAFTPAVTTSPGVVYEGSWDGKMRAFSADTGAVLWEYDTIRHFAGVNGVTGSGSALSGNGGAVVSGGMMFVQSGYFPYPIDTGFVLLAFRL